MKKYLTSLLLLLLFITSIQVKAQYNYNYSAIDYNYIDISGTGTLIAELEGVDDGLSNIIPLGDEFNFFGTKYNAVIVGSNGFLTLNTSETSSDYSNSEIPNADGPSLMIAPFWDDLTVNGAASVYYRDMGDHFIVMYENMAHYSGTNNKYFEVKLFYDTGIIEFHYDSMDLSEDSPTVGVENLAEDKGLQMHYNGSGAAINSFSAYKVNPYTVISASTYFGTETWTLVNSPYLIDGDIDIATGATLIIEPGVEVYFNNSYDINMHGRLLAEGTEQDSILFTAFDQSNGWDRLYFHNVATSNDSTKFRYCRFEHGSISGDGGAFYIYNSPKILIDHCHFENNYASSEGGAIYVGYSNIRITNCTFKNNSSQYGGAINGYYADFYAEGNTFENNTASSYGGAVRLYRSSAAFYNNLFTNNTANSYGGALYAYQYYPEFHYNEYYHNNASRGGALYLDRTDEKLYHNIFGYNTASSYGGALYSYYRYSSNRYKIANNLIFRNEANYGGGFYFNNVQGYKYGTNNTIVYNHANTNGGGIYYTSSFTSYEYNTIIYGNTAANEGNQIYLNSTNSDPRFYNCNIQGEVEDFAGSGTGNNYNTSYFDGFDYPPEFQDAENDNFRLQSGSPLLNLGNNGSLSNFNLEYDLDKNDRIYLGSNQTVDLGAYEYQGEQTNVRPIISAVDYYRIKPDRVASVEMEYLDFDDQDVLSASVSSNSPNVTVTDLVYSQTTANFTIQTADAWEGTAEITFEVNDNTGEYNAIAKEGFEIRVSTDTLGGDMLISDLYSGEIFIAEPLIIPNDMKLSIEHNSEVTILGQQYIDVKGSLQCLGKPDSLITFLPFDTNEPWEGIRLNNPSSTNDSTILTYCELAYTNTINGFSSGGALYVYHYNNMRVENCKFHNNSAVYGGGAYLRYANIIFRNNEVFNNHSNSWGGGLYMDNFDNGIFNGNAIYDNKSLYMAGGAYLASCEGKFANNTIIRNQANRGAGGIYFGGGSPRLYNSILWDNYVLNGSLNQYLQQSANVYLYNNILQQGIEFQVYYASNNSTDAPNFVDLDGNDFQLTSNSISCINKGVTSSVYNYNDFLPTDIGLNERVYENDRVDIGAFEYQGESPVNNLPILSEIGEQIIAVNDTKNITITYDEVDAGDDNTIYLHSSNPNVVIDNLSGYASGSSFDLNATNNFSGEAEITVIVYDNSGDVEDINSETFTLHVGNIEYLCGNYHSDYTVTSDIVIINCSVRFYNNSILTIPEGTLVLSNGSYIYMNGYIHAMGTEENPIRFSVLDGYENSGWDGFYMQSVPNDNHSIFEHCIFEYGYKSYALFDMEYHDNITFNHCTFKNNWGYRGSVINAYYSDYTMSNCEFHDNYTTDDGGVIYNNYSNAEITNSSFNNNKCFDRGGIIYQNRGDLILKDCNISDNSTPNYGGALYLNYANYEILNNSFNENLAYYGGAIYYYRGGGLTQNNIFRNNGAAYRAGACYYQYGSSSDVYNNTFVNNYAESQGGAVYLRNGTDYVYNNIFYNNESSNSSNIYVEDHSTILYYNLIGDLDDQYLNTNSKGKNIDLDPEFVDMNSDLHLTSNSPCINTGITDTSGLGLYEFDMDGNPRENVDGDFIDMGAYEFQATPDYYNINFDVEEDITLDESLPLRLVSDLHIEYLNTLTIAPGTDFYVLGHQEIDVQGTIKAIGTSSERITFTTTNPGDYVENTETGWGGFVFDNTSYNNDQSEFAYCTISYTNKYNGNSYATGGAIFMREYGAVSIDNCELINNFSHNQGGAIYIFNGLPSITNSTFENNKSNNNGGAIYAQYSTPQIENNEFIGNEASSGGGVHLYECYSSPYNNYFYNNHVQNYGGGLYLWLHYNSLEENHFENNYAEGYGGGMYANQSSFNIYNQLFVGNSAENSGGGIYLTNSGSGFYNNIFYQNEAYNGGAIFTNYTYADFYNNTIVENDAENRAGAIYNTPGYSMNIYNSIIRDNTADVPAQLYANGVQNLYNCNISDDFTSWTNFSGSYNNNINFDPKFVDPENHDFSLQSNSPCINTGTPDISSFSMPSTDFAGNERVNDDHQDIIDMGAYEYNSEINYYNVNTDYYADYAYPSGKQIRLYQDIYVSNLSTLTIPAGATVMAMDHFMIRVDGRILAQGNNNQPITFKAFNNSNIGTSSTSGWQGFVYENTPNGNDTSRFEYCYFHHGNKTSPTYDLGGMFYISDFSKVAIENAHFDENYAENKGGAIYLSSANPRINLCTFNNNSANSSGGAIYLHYADANMLNNTYTNNMAIYGGAVYSDYSSNDFSNSSFSDNEAEENGGAMVAASGDANLSGATFSNNTSYNIGGGLYLQGGTFTLEKATFQNNASEYGGGLYINSATGDVTASRFSTNEAVEGGGIYAVSFNSAIYNSLFHDNSAEKGGGLFFLSSSPEIYNNTIADNAATLFGGGFYLTSNSSPVIMNSIIYNNTSNKKGQQLYINNDNSNPEFYYNDVQGGLDAFEGIGSGNYYNEALYTDNIDFDPLFSSAKAESYELTPTSYCVDGGIADTTGMGIPTVDLIDSARVYNDVRIDMGAYELQEDPGNRLPILTKVGNQITETNTTLTLTCEFEDVDLLDTHTIDITSSSADVTVSYAGNTSGTTYDLIPAVDFKGEVEITVTIDDGSGEVSDVNSETFTLMVGDVIDLCGTIATDSVLSTEIVRVNCNVIIPDGVTLTVPAGTYVEFQDYYYFQINGRLIAEGTSSDSIIFSVPSSMIATGWAGIRFDVDSSTNVPSSIDYCHFEHTNNPGDGGAIYIINSEELTISNSFFTNNIATRGAGIYLNNSDAEITSNTFYKNESTIDGGAISAYDSTNLVISNNIFNDNTASSGGAIYFWDSKFLTSEISNNEFINNTGDAGGAIYLNKANPVIQNNTFEFNSSISNGGALYTNDTCYIQFTNNMVSNNFASANGGALYLFDSDSLDVENNIFSGNYTGSNGGAVYVYLTDANIINNLIYDNYANNGGAFFLWNSSPLLVNNSVTNNEAANLGGGLYTDNSYPDVYNTISYYNSASGGDEVYAWTGSPNIYYSNIEGGTSAIGGFFFGDYENNLDVNPQFNDLIGNDYTLANTSDCINKGTPNNVLSGLDASVPSTDLNNNARIYNNIRIDIGAYEMQNNPPTQISLAPNTIAENAPVNSVIGDLITTDQDGGAFTYSLDTSAVNYTLFNISGNKLQTSVLFDYETDKYIGINVITDDGNGGTYKESLTVEITDVNDNAPVVEDAHLIIAENKAVGSELYQVIYSDRDLNNGEFTFSIADGDSEGKFAMSTGGMLSLAEELDFETTSTYSLTILVNDGAQDGTATFTIDVTDINEEAPVIESGSATIAENTPIGDTVLTLTATDADPSTELHYAIYNGNSRNSFKVGHNGEIIVNRKLDYETNRSYDITIEVTDNVNKVYANAYITITDINDNSPVVYGGFAEVDEYAPAGTEVFTVTASDADSGSSFSFAIEEGNSENKFSINANSGLITLTGTLNYQETEQYNLTVSASDGTYSGESDVIVYVIDSIEIDTTGTAIGNLPWDALSLYPNPAAHFITLEMQAYESNELTFIIRNILGETIIMEEHEHIKSNFVAKINVSELESGIYFIDLIDDELITTLRFVKE